MKELVLGKTLDDSDSPCLENYFQVAIVMHHRVIENNIWLADQWEVDAIIAGGKGDAGDIPVKTVSRIGTNEEHYIWANYQIHLFADEAESYYFNIISDTPYVFVVCRDEEEDGELVPFKVSVNYDEVSSFLELEEQVFQVPMPAEIYLWLESFVVNNYVPMKRKKRKREDWKGEHKKDNRMAH